MRLPCYQGQSIHFGPDKTHQDLFTLQQEYKTHHSVCMHMCVYVSHDEWTHFASAQEEDLVSCAMCDVLRNFETSVPVFVGATIEHSVCNATV